MVSGLWFIVYGLWFMEFAFDLFSFYSHGILEDAASEVREAGQFAVNR